MWWRRKKKKTVVQVGSLEDKAAGVTGEFDELCCKMTQVILSEFSSDLRARTGRTINYRRTLYGIDRGVWVTELTMFKTCFNDGVITPEDKTRVVLNAKQGKKSSPWLNHNLLLQLSRTIHTRQGLKIRKTSKKHLFFLYTLGCWENTDLNHPKNSEESRVLFQTLFYSSGLTEILTRNWKG